MRSLQKYLLTTLLSVFVLVSYAFFSPVHAAEPPLIFDIATQPKTATDYLKEYCDKRSGDLMNLETWYSGKCGDDVDTLSGEGVGFSDIIILQGLEYFFGAQQDSFIESVVKKIKILEAIQGAVRIGDTSSLDTNLASLNKDSGIVSSLGSLTTKIITTRPASSMDYLAYVSSNLKNKHIVSKAIAAGPGYGFQALSPILPLWRAFRNVSYLLFALGFVIYGIMIMFRIRIDAKTAATVQLAIPKLIITLLMITFSYAIVGLLIDISTVVSALLINVLKAGGLLSETPYLATVAGGTSWFGAVGSVIVNSFTAVIVSPFIFFNLIIGGIFGTLVAVVASIAGVLSGLGLIITVIIMIAVGIGYFKLIMKLFQAYFSVIINLIFAPIILLGNLFPGTDSFGSWLRTIYGNLAVFPVAVFFLTLSYALMAQPILSLISGIDAFTGLGGTAGLETILGVKALSSAGTIWTPPMTLGIGGEKVGSLILATIGFGLLLMSSKYCEMVEKALKVPPFPYGAAIGEALKYGSAQTGKIAPENFPRIPIPGRFAGARDTAIEWGLRSATKAGGQKTQPPTSAV